jgi:hypothetical protein
VDLESRQVVKNHESALMGQLVKALTYKPKERNLPRRSLGLFTTDREEFISDLLPLLDPSYFAYTKRKSGVRKKTVEDILAIREALHALPKQSHRYNASYVYETIQGHVQKKRDELLASGQVEKKLPTGPSLRRIRQLWDVAIFEDKYPVITDRKGSPTINLNSYALHPEEFRAVIRELLVVKATRVRQLIDEQIAAAENQSKMAKPLPTVTIQPSKIPPASVKPVPDFNVPVYLLPNSPSNAHRPSVLQQMLVFFVLLEGGFHQWMTQIGRPADAVHVVDFVRQARRLAPAA